MGQNLVNLTPGASPYRLDENLHKILNGPLPTGPRPRSEETPLSLPEPPYPQHPLPEGREYTEREYQKINAMRTWQCWGAPFFKSLWHLGELRPIIAYLFSEWKCNLDCHYCWAFENSVKGMTEDVARRSIDWLEGIGCRVLALMGGEPLLRPGFIHKVTYYAAKKNFFVYLPTNGRLMRPEVIDRLGDAGLATFNLAVDAVKVKPGLPKALEPIRPYFEHLVKRQRRYGYTVMLNMNITHINHDDVRELTEIAHDHGVATDYHICEAPLIEQSHFNRLEENQTYLRPEDFPKVDELLDWIIEKHRQGYKMPNPQMHMLKMKELMRGHVDPWPCRAGQNTLIIRTDGTLAPCFPMYSATYDWGSVENPKFDVKQLDEMKKDCTTHCLSTCNYILAHCYNARRVIWWGLKQAAHGFRGAKGTL